MPVFILGRDPIFPDPRLADDNGLLAIGGDLSAARLVQAYTHGIFPWPIGRRNDLWFSPDPRMVLELDAFRPARSLRATIRRGGFTVTIDTAFDAVIRACASTPRSAEGGTWIGAPIVAAYRNLHELGWAHSFETWRDGELVGGLYGVSIGAMFCGESMFHRASDASKVAFAALVEFARAHAMHFIDCQVYTDHLASLGACEVTREVFLARLSRAVTEPTLAGPWTDRGAALGAPLGPAFRTGSR